MKVTNTFFTPTIVISYFSAKPLRECRSYFFLSCNVVLGQSSLHLLCAVSVQLVVPIAAYSRLIVIDEFHVAFISGTRRFCWSLWQHSIDAGSLKTSLHVYFRSEWKYPRNTFFCGFWMDGSKCIFLDYVLTDSGGRYHHQQKQHRGGNDEILHGEIYRQYRCYLGHRYVSNVVKRKVLHSQSRVSIVHCCYDLRTIAFPQYPRMIGTKRLRITNGMKSSKVIWKTPIKKVCFRFETPFSPRICKHIFVVAFNGGVRWIPKKESKAAICESSRSGFRF